MTIPRILIIAGSDSGGGAGIQADIKTVTMLGGHATTAVTAITAQNTLGVDAVMPVPTQMVLQQMEAVIGDIGVDAVKIGMIGSAETAHAVAERLVGLDVPIVFDPVMVATSGSVLADRETIAAFERLMRLATLVTPNAPELEALGPGIGGGEAAARSLGRRAGTAVLAKGGDLAGPQVIDILVHGGEITRWQSERIDTLHTHGTGCTLASAITINLANGRTLADAVDAARRFVRLSLREAPGFGGGHGPMGQQDVRLDLPLDDHLMLNQVTLPASDYDASTGFYRALGLAQIVDAPPRYARFEVAGGMTLSIEVSNPADPPGRSEHFFQCADLDGTVRRLESAGIRFHAAPEDRSYGWRVAETRDPHGNRICLYDPGENRRFPPWRISGSPGSSA
ncbi:MAG TPA: bifunctional hydroxymethylpyrimidine kinase/phosphomethylpyrimidine kinase [Allosphingosinicella sp.]|jgi:hydroxymethylpyrimidine/phosphomethylpyrimidine kinase